MAKYKLDYALGNKEFSISVNTLDEVYSLINTTLKMAKQAEQGCAIMILNEKAAEWQDELKLADFYGIDLCQDKDVALEDVEYAISTSEDIKRSEDLLKIKKYLLTKAE